MAESFFKITQPTLKELLKATNNYLRLYNGEPTEFDMSINDISIDIPRAMLKEYGQCWIGNINIQDKSELPYKLTKYNHTETALYTFGYAFVIPAYDAELERMINDRAMYTEPYNGTKDMKKIVAITNRIDELNGIMLVWA